jgi:hypothetical protein
MVPLPFLMYHRLCPLALRMLDLSASRTLLGWIAQPCDLGMPYFRARNSLRRLLPGLVLSFPCGGRRKVHLAKVLKDLSVCGHSASIEDRDWAAE